MGSMSLNSLTHAPTPRGFDALIPLLATKLGPPCIRRGVVERTALLDGLASETTPTVISVVAPAGFGKSTLLRQWADRDPRPGAWLTVDDDDNDPFVLLTYLAAALDRITPVDPEVLEQLAVPYPSLHVTVSALGDADSLLGGIGLQNQYTFRLVQQLVDDVVLVSEEEIARAMAFLLQEQHLVAEGAGAVGVAALLAGKIANLGSNVGVVISGGNVALDDLLRAVKSGE